MKIEVGKFPQATALERVTVLSKYEKLYDNEQFAVLGVHKIIKEQYNDPLDLVYLAHAIPSRVSEFYGDFVQGDGEKMIIEVKDDDNENDIVKEIVETNKIKAKIYDRATDQSEFGFFVWLVRTEGKKAIIEHIPQDQYFPQKDGSVIFATLIKDPNAQGAVDYLLCLTQNYEIINGKVHILREAWKTDKQGVVQSPFDFQTIIQYTGQPELLQEETIAELDELPIIKVTNGREGKEGFGKSDYADIMPQLSELNEKATHVSTVILKNLNAKMALNPSSIEAETGKQKSEEAFIVEEGEITPKYIVNENPLLDATENHIMRTLKTISWVTAVPMDVILKGNMPEKVEAMKMNLYNAERRTNTKRGKITEGIKDALKIACKMLGTPLKGEIKVKYGDVLPTSQIEIVQAESEKVTAGLSSKRSAIKRMEGYSEAEVEAELAMIEEENKVAGVGDSDIKL